MGMEKIVTVKTHENLFKVVATADFESEVNARVFAHFAESKIHFFDDASGENLAR
jgi:hypothetical protein